MLAGLLRQTEGSAIRRIGWTRWRRNLAVALGNARRTVQNLKVVAVRPEDNVILISGAVPGARGSYLVIRPAKKK